MSLSHYIVDTHHQKYTLPTACDKIPVTSKLYGQCIKTIIEIHYMQHDIPQSRLQDRETKILQSIPHLTATQITDLLQHNAIDTITSPLHKASLYVINEALNRELLTKCQQEL